MLYLNDHIEDFTEAQTLQIIDTLPQWRKEAAMRFRHLEGRKECALAYVELCRGLQLEYGIEGMPDFDIGKHGKPRLHNLPHIHFSLSHCKAAVGCLLSDTPCGLDIERIRQPKDSLVRHTMNNEESDRIFQSDRPEVTFTMLWTQKEAVAKLLGTGINMGVREILRNEQMKHIRLQTTDNSAMGYVLTEAWQI